MQITTKQLYSKLDSLKKLFSYKRIKSISLEKLPDLIQKSYDNLQFRPKVDFNIRVFTNLANSVNANIIPSSIIEIFYLGEFVRTNSFPKLTLFETEATFKEAMQFYSANAVTAQTAEVNALAASADTKISKFMGKKTNVFDIREDQTSVLYDMLISGKINIIVYAYCLKENLIHIDFSKIKDLTVYRNNKIAEYISGFDLKNSLI